MNALSKLTALKFALTQTKNCRYLDTGDILVYNSASQEMSQTGSVFSNPLVTRLMLIVNLDSNVSQQSMQAKLQIKA